MSNATDANMVRTKRATVDRTAIRVGDAAEQLGKHIPRPIVEATVQFN